MKILKISTCNECPDFKSCSAGDNNSGEYCYHPEVMKGIISKQIDTTHYDNTLSILIPDWCPLENY